jgi:hypothetical protein
LSWIPQECLSDKSSNVSKKKDKSSNDLQPPLEYRIGLSYFYNDPWLDEPVPSIIVCF